MFAMISIETLKSILIQLFGRSQECEGTKALSKFCCASM